MNRSSRHWTEQAQRDLEFMKLLETAGGDSLTYAVAKMSEAPGFELPVVAQQHVITQAQLNSARHYRPPSVDPEYDLIFAEHFKSRVPVAASARRPFRWIVAGASGSGKTNLVFILMELLRRRLRLRIVAWEYKPELQRIIPVWKDAVLFTPRTAPWHFLKPVGPDKLAYYIGLISELRLEFELRPETVPLLWQIIERMLRGMQPTDPQFSWEDLRRVVEHEAFAQRRENLHTLARALLSLCVVLGPMAAARRVPEVPEHIRLTGYDFVAQDPALLRLFLGFDFNRLLFQAQSEGHTDDFRRLYVFDEGSVLFSTELMNRGMAHLSAAKRFVSMCRFTGTGFIIGVQNVSQLDSFVCQNGDFLAVFRCGSYEDAVLGAKMLGLEPSAYQDLMRLPTGVAYVRSADWEQAVKVRIPLFQP